MKKMNWFCLVLALLMCLCMLPATAGAATIASPIVYTGEMDVDLPDNDELFAGYVERELNRAIYGDISMFGTLARDHLTERQRKAYDVLKPQIEQVARGERASTVFVLDKASDYLASTTITAEQLGLDAIFTVSGGYYTYTDEATQKIFDILEAELIVPVWQALIHDCPYDVYWRDSGYYCSFDVSYFDLTTIVLDSIELKVEVSVDYGSEFTVNTALASATSTAVANAKAIVEKHKAKDDWAKLEAYRDEIHALTDYNHPAADNDDTPYGDPWQLIYVFDKNPSTLVVCEGYSKAFKFLCDLSTFEGDVWCYCVSGLMDGGRHMWNIVTVDGVNYMADITNSDAGSIGQNGGLYMVDEPESGTWDTQYTFKPGNCTYKYDADVIDMWGEEVLKLGGASLHTHSWGEPAYEWSEDFEDCFATNSCTDCGEEVTIEAIVLGYFTDGNCVTPTLYTYRAVFSEEWAGVQEKTIELGVEPDVHTGETVVKNAVEATCGNAGYTGDTHCAACDAKLSDGTAIDPTGAHSYTVEVEGTKVPATCVAEGKVTKKCANCDATKEETLPIDSTNHTGDTVVKNAKEATCGEAGYTGDTHCAACDAKLSDGEEIDPTGAHSYTVEVEGSKVPATCVDEGKITKKCANCDATKEETLPIDSANHTGETIVKNAKEADCGNAGYTGDTHCADCDAKLADGEVIPSTGNHAYTVEVEGSKVPATCVDEGKVTKKCSGCEATKEEILPIDSTNHTGDTVVKNAKEATCGEAGYTGDTHCAACDAKLSDGEEIDPTGAHSYTVEVEGSKVPATCIAEGKITKKCANCDATKEETLPIDPANHTGETIVKNAKEADCGNAGYTGDTHCADCDAKLADGEPIPATEAHQYTVEVEGSKVPATCIAEGKITKKCANCDATKEEILPIDSTNHTGETIIKGCVEPSCAQPGYTGDTHCAGCDAKLADGEPIPATGEHNFATETERKDPSCTEDGYVIMACGCGETQTTVLESTGHNAGEAKRENEVPATCQAAGSYDEVVRCTKCNEILSSEAKTIEKLAHIPGEMVIENKVEATTEAEGSYDEVTRCTKCNEIITSEHKIIPKLEEEVQQYTVTVTNGTGSGVYTEGAQVAIAAQVPANMKFIGWAGAEGLTFTTGSNATVNAVFTMPGRNVSLTAVLEEDLPEASSNVAFNANGGAGSMPTLTVSTGSTLALPTCGFTAPAGKQFAGWAYAADGEAITSPIVVTEDITLYAIWEDAIVEGDKPVIISTSGPVANVSEGETATLSVTATGADSYQWYINRGAGWEILPGATGSSYTTGAANDATSGYQYYCEVSNAFGSVNSHVFQLQMDDAGTPPQTGDNAQLGLWMMLMLLSAAGMIMLLAKMDRKAW